MKNLIRVVTAIVIAGSISVAQARDTRHMFPIKNALAKGDAFKTKIDPSIKLYFGKPAPAVAKTMGSWTSNKKTNAANKSDEEACEIAFISAVVGLQERAQREGGNALINIHSVYKNENVESQTEYLCGAGAFMAGVALRGTVVKLK